MARKPFYGWYIVGVAFLSFFVGGSTNGFSFSIFLPPMYEDLGWSRSTIVLAQSIAAVVSAVVGPALGYLVDRRGPRLVLIVSIILMAVSLAATGLVDQPWQFYLTFGLLGGIARTATSSVVPGALIAAWFIRRRSTAYGLTAMGPPFSNFFLPPVVTILVASMGWRATWIAMGALALVVGLPPALFVARGRPEDLGLLPDGDLPEPEPDPTTADLTTLAKPARTEDWTAREALHSPAFWMVAAGMAFILLAPNTSVIFMFSYFSSKGMSTSVAAAAVSAVSAMQVLSRLVFWTPVIGRLGSVRWAVMVWGGLLLCSSLLLATVQNEFWAYIAAGVLGLGLGGNLVLQLQIWPEYFGRTAIGSIIGMSQLVGGLTSAAFPLFGAALIDHTGDYNLLYAIVAMMVVIGLVCHLIAGQPRRPAATAP